MNNQNSTPQSAILPEAGAHALFMFLQARPGKTAQQAILSQCALIDELAAQIDQDDTEAGLVASVAFGSEFWNSVYPDARPVQLKNFAPISGRYQAPATDGDIFLHVHSQRLDLNFELARRLLNGVGDHVRVIEEVHGFRYLDARDLTGFIDGTENPQGAERAEVALIGEEDATFAGGSYLLVQRYVHDLAKWQTIVETEQEQVIGRTKPDSVELDDSIRPNTAHISRVVIEEKDEELEILRHSMPYGLASGESGLLFLAYSRDLSIFEKMLERMFGTSGDGLSDHLLDFTRPVNGGFFFAPSKETLRELTDGRTPSLTISAPS